ncbi:hypothetical protein [Streptomyces sviceus]|uniref:hypothetical protein n=1 Tax=Streptomyces sviceus TaxID=285530 RepID=UPI00369E73BC
MLEHAQTLAGKRKQPKAIEDGPDAGVPWGHFTEVLCVTSEQGAHQARRLKAEQLREPGARRTPKPPASISPAQPPSNGPSGP